MGHLVSREPWGTIDLDTTLGRVFIQEDWFYEWRLWPGVTADWTYAEKRDTHTLIDRQIWGIWSNRVQLRASGRSDFARRFGPAPVGVNFDVRWDLRLPAHWTVRVWKMPPTATATEPHHSHVQIDTRVVELNTADLYPRGAMNDAGDATSDFLTAPHEFGHTVGAPADHLRDEYRTGHSNLGDTASLMNVGRQLRRRHMRDVLAVLHRLVPGTRFTSNLPA